MKPISFAAKLEASAYLNFIYQKYFQDTFPDKSIDAEQVMTLLQTEIDALANMPFAIASDKNASSAYLRSAKAKFSFFWSLASLFKLAEFQQLGRLQTQFAEISIQQALRCALLEEKLITEESPDAYLPGIFILGLGKLGGNDLNFSSDVDIIAFFDKEQLPKRIQNSSTSIVSKCLKRMSTLLSANIEQEFVWRVDWRLRPNAATQYLCQSVEVAKDFYLFHAQPWHRLALIKARIVAGDNTTGQQFMEDIYSFLWRKNLDFRDVDEIKLIKQKINLEHPNLKHQRTLSKEVALNESARFNLKLGHGGIREIEFIVNALQLLWGGKKESLQTKSTLKNLAILANENLLEENISTQLAEAYQFFRQAENALQMMENLQSYHVPQEELAKEKLCTLLDCDFSDFEEQLIKQRSNVSEYFLEFFNLNEQESTNVAKVYTKIKNQYELTEASIEILDYWFDGFTFYGVNPQAGIQFQALTPLLIKEIKKSNIEFNEALSIIHTYFCMLPPGGQYLRLLLAKPKLLKKLIRPLLLSNAMRILLFQSPHIIEHFVDYKQTSANFEKDKHFVTFINDYEERLERLRRVTNENLYAIYLAYLLEKIDFDELEQQLSKKAQQLIELSLDVVLEELNMHNSPIAVIGFGKLGMQAMGPKSDIDVLFLFANKQQQEIAGKVTSRLVTAINSKMREGQVYELDDRLRPYGRSGNITISLESFDNYQIKHAKTWEHLALSSAEFIAGDESIIADFLQIKNNMLSMPRNLQAFYQDCFDMLQLIRKQRIIDGKDLFIAKLASGGQMELEYLINALILKYSINSPEIQTLSYFDKLHFLAKKENNDIAETAYFFRKFQSLVRLFGQEKTEIKELPSYIQTRILKDFNCASMDDFLALLEKKKCLVLTYIENFFADQKIIKDKKIEFKPVRWQND